jgi:hypothetical protein
VALFRADILGTDKAKGSNNENLIHSRAVGDELEATLIQHLICLINTDYSGHTSVISRYCQTFESSAYLRGFHSYQGL